MTSPQIPPDSELFLIRLHLYHREYIYIHRCSHDLLAVLAQEQGDEEEEDNADGEVQECVVARRLACGHSLGVG